LEASKRFRDRPICAQDVQAIDNIALGAVTTDRRKQLGCLNNSFDRGCAGESSSSAALDGGMETNRNAKRSLDGRSRSDSIGWPSWASPQLLVTYTKRPFARAVADSAGCWGTFFNALQRISKLR
jgi:hypothetical protein